VRKKHYNISKYRPVFQLQKKGYYKIKKRIKTKGREWIEQLRQDQDSFPYEFRKRYEEMLLTQRELQDIAQENKHRDPVAARRS
jgi:hypothetical protein